MLQISQIEKPRCSATIDQMRFRCAMALPPEFQNFSSSGFHSEIQRVFPLLIESFLLKWLGLHGTFRVGRKQKPPRSDACASPQCGGVASRPVVGPAARPRPSRAISFSSFVPEPEFSRFECNIKVLRGKPETPTGRFCTPVLPNRTSIREVIVQRKK